MEKKKKWKKGISGVSLTEYGRSPKPAHLVPYRQRTAEVSQSPHSHKTSRNQVGCRAGKVLWWTMAMAVFILENQSITRHAHVDSKDPSILPSSREIFWHSQKFGCRALALLEAPVPSSGLDEVVRRLEVKKLSYLTQHSCPGRSSTRIQMWVGCSGMVPLNTSCCCIRTSCLVLCVVPRRSPGSRQKSRGQLILRKARLVLCCAVRKASRARIKGWEATKWHIGLKKKWTSF